MAFRLRVVFDVEWCPDSVVPENREEDTDRSSSELSSIAEDMFRRVISIGLSKKLTLSVMVRRLLFDSRLAGRMYVFAEVFAVLVVSW